MFLCHIMWKRLVYSVVQLQCSISCHSAPFIRVTPTDHSSLHSSYQVSLTQQVAVSFLGDHALVRAQRRYYRSKTPESAHIFELFLKRYAQESAIFNLVRGVGFTDIYLSPRR